MNIRIFILTVIMQYEKFIIFLYAFFYFFKYFIKAKRSKQVEKT